MNPTARIVPRKLPRQRRSRLLVDRILDSAAAILARDGLDALTTNRIAEEASVSVGSIYQYFPNKNAIVAALVEDLVRGVESDILSMMRGAEPGYDAGALSRQIIGRLVGNILAKAGVIRALAPHISELQRLGVTGRPEDMIRQAGRGFILASATRLRQTNLEAALFVTVECLAHLIRRYLEAPPPGLGTDEFVALLADLTTRFLYQEPPAGADPAVP